MLDVTFGQHLSCKWCLAYIFQNEGKTILMTARPWTIVKQKIDGKLWNFLSFVHVDQAVTLLKLTLMPDISKSAIISNVDAKHTWLQDRSLTEWLQLYARTFLSEPAISAIIKQYLEHYDTRKYCKCGEHHIVYRRHNGSIKSVQSLKNKKKDSIKKISSRCIKKLK